MNIPPNDDYLIGYLAHFYSAQHRAYYGGLLVTDTRGVPKEFRHSEAIRPSRLQQSLYGDSLEPALGSDALAPSLYDALTLRPHLLCIEKQSRSMFGPFLARRTPAAMLVALADPDLAFAETFDDDGALLEAREFALKGDAAQRVYAYLADNPAHPSGSAALHIAQSRMNLITPFDRVREVLAQVAQAEADRQK